MARILFVCTGNICRSPTAEGVFRHLAAQAGLGDAFETDSVGLGAWHVGEPPDSRSIRAATERGIDISDLRARQLIQADFADFELLLAMDRGHYRELARRAPREHADRVRMFMEAADGRGGVAEAADGRGTEVPDPYYGGADGFEAVLDMIEDGSRAWLKKLEGWV